MKYHFRPTQHPWPILFSLSPKYSQLQFDMKENSSGCVCGLGFPVDDSRNLIATEKDGIVQSLVCALGKIVFFFFFLELKKGFLS